MADDLDTLLTQGSQGALGTPAAAAPSGVAPAASASPAPEGAAPVVATAAPDADPFGTLLTQGSQAALPQPASAGAYPVGPGDITGYGPNIGKGILQGSAGTMNLAAQPSGTLASPFATTMVFIHDALAPYLGYERFPKDVRDFLLNDQVPQAGTQAIEAINRATGGPDLSRVKPADAGQAYAGLAWQGATGAVQTAPLFGLTKLATVPVTAGTGATGAATGYTLGQFVPDWARPYAEQFGNWIGGLGFASLAAGLHGITRGTTSASDALATRLGVGSKQTFVNPDTDAPFIDPRTMQIDRETGEVTGGTPVQATPRQAAAAGQMIAHAAGETPAEAAANVVAQPAGVPGQATMGQLRGNQILLNFERNAKNLSPGVFQSSDAHNAAARFLALSGMAPPDDVASAASDFVQRRLAEINAATPEEQNARNYVAGLPALPDVSPSETGAKISQHVAQAQAPAITQSEQRLAQAGQAQTAAAQAVGGSPTTDVQEIGHQTRAALTALDQEKQAQVNRLADRIDPTGTLAVDMSPVIDAGKAINRQFANRPNLTKPEADVQALIDRAANQPGVASFQDLRDLRQSLTDRLMAANRNGEGQHAAWLNQLIAGIHTAMAETAGRKAIADQQQVAAGQMSPDQAIGPRLAAGADGEPVPATVPKTPTVAYTPAGREIGVRYGVVEGNTLRTSHNNDLSVNRTYPQELQPRERDRTASELQITRMANTLQPQRLGASTSVMDGAPIVGPDGVVEHGNGRTIAIRRAYAANGKEAQAYRDFLRVQGFDTEGMRNPILVRHRTTELTPAERIRYAQEGASEQALALSASERAKIDASRIDDNVLNLYAGGDVRSLANVPFQRAFLRNVLEPGQEGSFTSRGELTVEGAARMRNALLHKAYGDSNLVAQLAEHGDENMRAFGNALTSAAPAMARVAQEVAAGRVDPEMAIGPHLTEAANIVRQARAARTSIANVIGQSDAFGGVSPITEQVLRWAYGPELRGRLNSARLADGLEWFAQEARKQLVGPRLFEQNLAPGELLREAQRRAETIHPQQVAAGGAIPGGAAGVIGGYGAGGPEARGPGAGPAGQAGAVQPADAATARGQGAAQSGRVILPRELPTPNLTDEAAQAYAAMRAAHQERMSTFHEGPLGAVLAPGAFKGQFATDESRLAPLIFRSGGGSPEAIQQFQRMIGGATDADALRTFGEMGSENVPAAMAARHQAMGAIQRYASYAMTRAATRNGEFRPDLARQWMTEHRAALDAFPELRQNFKTLADAAERRNDVIAERKALDDSYPLANAKTFADLTGRYVQSGPRGGEMVQQYMRDTGGTPEAMHTLDSAIASDLRAKAMKGADWSKVAYDNWMDSHRSLLAQRPELAKLLGTMQDAQTTLANVAADRATQVKGLQDSAMGHYLTKGGEPVEPAAAMRSLFGSPTSVSDARSLVKSMRNDPVALAGLRRNAYDWLANKVLSSAEAGTTRVPEIKPHAFIKQVMGNQQVHDTLSEIFTPEQMEVMRGVMQSLLYEQMGRNATAIKGSPGTASDAHAMGHEPTTGLQMIIGERLGDWLGRALHAHPKVAAMVHGAGIVAGAVHGMMRQAGMKTIQDLYAMGVANPQLGKVFLQHAITDPKSPILDTLGRRLATVVAAGAAAGGR